MVYGSMILVGILIFKISLHKILFQRYFYIFKKIKCYCNVLKLFSKYLILFSKWVELKFEFWWLGEHLCVCQFLHWSRTNRWMGILVRSNQVHIPMEFKIRISSCEYVIRISLENVFKMLINMIMISLEYHGKPSKNNIMIFLLYKYHSGKSVLFYLYDIMLIPQTLW